MVGVVVFLSVKLCKKKSKKETEIVAQPGILVGTKTQKFATKKMKEKKLEKKTN